MVTFEKSSAISELDAERIQVKNPITGELLGEIPVTDPQGVRAAVERARVAQPAWEALGVRGRTTIIQRWIDAVWARRHEAVRIIRQETGKAENSALAELVGVDAVMAYYIKQAPKILKSHDRRAMIPFAHKARVHYKAHGVAGMITPWNFPFNLPFMDGVPALIAGNAVVFKPSEITPYSCEFGVSLLHEAGVPSDVAQIVHGDGRTGAALVDEVDFIGFTGSTASGRRVAMRAAERLIPYSLELGGKDPMIVLDDADVKTAAVAMLRGAMENSGQFCMSVERVYVEMGIYDQLIEAVKQQAQQYRVDSAAGTDVNMGSLTNERELIRTERHVADALQKGATLLHGGQRLPALGPLFYDVTILTDVDHTMDVMREETFGPILPIMKVANADEAVQLANDSQYGLAASVYSRDLKRAEAVARRIDTGDVSINATQFVVATPSLPSGGQRESGVGRRNGPEGLLRYVSSQSLLINNGFGQEPALNMLDSRTLKLVEGLRRVRKYLPFI